jgi:hypothetical protein
MTRPPVPTSELGPLDPLKAGFVEWLTAQGYVSSGLRGQQGLFDHLNRRNCQDLWMGPRRLPCSSPADHLLPVVLVGGLTAKCSGPSKSLIATSSKQWGHGAPAPRRRAKTLQSSQRCSPSRRASQLGHS